MLSHNFLLFLFWFYHFLKSPAKKKFFLKFRMSYPSIATAATRTAQPTSTKVCDVLVLLPSVMQWRLPITLPGEARIACW